MAPGCQRAERPGRATQAPAQTPAQAQVPSSPPPAPGPLRVAAAADVEPALRAIAERFTAERARQVSLTFGSSGLLSQQIARGAPFDLFLAASRDFVDPLASSGRIRPGSVRAYARGTLVLWSRGIKTPGPGKLADLRDPRYTRIALANPEHAPYGRAAVLALRAAGLYDALKPRLVFGENVRQAHQYAQTGNASVALTAKSLALARDGAGDLGNYAEIAVPPGTLVQFLGTVAGGEEAGATALADVICGPAGQEILARFGFAPPAADSAAAPPVDPAPATGR